MFLVYKEYQWIRIKEQEVKDKRVTKVFNVYAKDGDVLLGVIRWHGPWRKYCYFPEPKTVYEWVCMTDIGSFCKEETKYYNEKGKHGIPRD
jgi:hypothetical protein